MLAIDRLMSEIRSVAEDRPVVVAFSGGLDSSVTAALARDALGTDRVLLVTVNMGQYAYRRGNEIVLEMADALGLPQRCLLGQPMQDRIMAGGPACNRCTREIKLGLVKKAAGGRLVLTGANRSDTWGQLGLKVCNGYYAPLLDMDKPAIREVADALGVHPPKIGEHPGREGCKLKHLLKPLVNPSYHGRAVSRANEAVLDAIHATSFPAALANVKVVGPLSRNIGLINVHPAPSPDAAAAILDAVRAVPELDEVHLVDRPIRLVAKASPSIVGDAHARKWLEAGRLQPDFAQPIHVEWQPTSNRKVSTFHVVSFAWTDAGVMAC